MIKTLSINRKKTCEIFSVYITLIVFELRAIINSFILSVYIKEDNFINLLPIVLYYIYSIYKKILIDLKRHKVFMYHLNIILLIILIIVDAFVLLITNT